MAILRLEACKEKWRLGIHQPEVGGSILLFGVCMWLGVISKYRNFLKPFVSNAAFKFGNKFEILFLNQILLDFKLPP